MRRTFPAVTSFISASSSLQRSLSSLVSLSAIAFPICFALMIIVSCSDKYSEEANNQENTEDESAVSSEESWKLVFDTPNTSSDHVARWISVAENGSEARFIVVPEGMEGKGHSLEAIIQRYGNGDRWDIQIYQDSVRVVPNQIYEYSVWIKGPVGGRVNVGVESTSYTSIKNKSSYLTGEWQVIAFEFLTTGETIRTPIHFGYSENVGKKIQIDNVELKMAE